MADKLHHKIIQLRERVDDSYLYPVTLYEAIKDKSGVGIAAILQSKLDEIKKLIPDVSPEEIDNIVTLVSSKVSGRESLLSTLASYYLRGLYNIDYTGLADITETTIYYSGDEPEGIVAGDFYISSVDSSIIQRYNGEEYESVDEDTMIFIYSCLSQYLKDRGSIRLTISDRVPTDPSSTTGDVHLVIGDTNNPYMWISPNWISMITGVSSVGIRMEIDPIVDLISIRYLNSTYSTSQPTNSADLWYDGSKSYYLSNGSYVEGSNSLTRLLSSIYEGRTVTTSYKVYICPARPVDGVNYRDVWIDIRNDLLYVNRSSTSNLNWVLCKSYSVNTPIYVGNLYTGSSDFSGDWIDYNSGATLDYNIIGPSILSGNQIIELTDKIPSKPISIVPGKVYTLSLSIDRSSEVSFDVENGEILTIQRYTEDIEGYTRYSARFYTNPGNTKCTCKPSISGTYRVHSVSLIEGTDGEWSISLQDVLDTLRLLLQSKVVSSKLYVGNSSNSQLAVRTDTNMTTAEFYHNSTWHDVSNVSGLVSAINLVGEIYNGSGTCTITTSHSEPSNPAIGDLWIDDALNALRWTGSRWGSYSGLLSSQYRELSGTIQELSDSNLRLAFATSTQDIQDIVDLASSLNKNIQVFRQDETPTSTVFVGDLWVTQTAPQHIYRWNGVDWVQSGATRLMDIEADASGLHITIGGTSGTIGSTIGTAMTNAANANTTANQANATAQDAYDLVDVSTRKLTIDLSNDSAQIPTLWDGSGANYTNATTTISVYYRGENVSNSASISISGTSTGIAYSFLNRVLTVSSMTSDTGYVDFSVSYSGLSSSIRFNLYKIKGGQPGGAGTDGLTSYTFIRYSDYSDGMSGGQPNFDSDPSRPYIGIAVVLGSSDLLPQGPSAPTEATSYKWSLYKGTDGSNGVSNAILYLYKRSTTAPSIDWTSILTYTFETRTLSPVPSGWSTEIPTGTNPLYVTAATARGRDSTDTIEYTEWSTPTLISSIGTDGTDGLNSATILLYQRADSIPSKPSGSLTYTFSTGVISGPTLGDWTKTIPPNNGKVLYVIQATAISSNSTDTIESNEWTTPVIYVEDGLPGNDGYSNAIIYLYKRSTTAATIDWTDTLTYTFATDTLSSIPSGWSRTIPGGSDPIYVTAATATSDTATDTIDYTEWSTPVVLSQNGTNGLNSATVLLYQRSSSIPSKPIGDIVYTFSDGSVSGSLGNWTKDIPTTNGNPLYVIQATAISTGSTDTIPYTEWSNPIVYAEDGTDGVGIISSIVRYKVSTSGTTIPSSTGWSTSIPTVPPGQYLWTRTIFVYTDHGMVTTYSVSYHGDDGNDGTSVTILGSYPSESDLRTAHPTGSPGDAYIVAGDLYVWSPDQSDWMNVGQIKGDQGDPGINSYVHFAYATSPSGADFSTSWFAAATYLGVYTDNNSSDSDTPSDYAWSLIKGADAIQYYTWIKYAPNTTPISSQMHDSPISGDKYIGIAYNKTSSTESTDYRDYTWSQIVGDKGEPGTDADPKYTWVVYATSSSGANITTTPTNSTTYIGIKYNQSSPTPSLTPSEYTFVKYIGSNGVSSYTFIVYAPTNTPTSSEWSTTKRDTDKYVGIANKSSNSTPTSYTEFQWSQIVGDKGDTGSAGADAVVRFLEIGESVIKASLDFMSYTPPILTFYAKQSSGSGTPTSIAAYYKVGYSVDGSTYTYTSIVGPLESNTMVIPIGYGYRYIRCILYYDQAGTQQLDDEIITVVTDSEELVDQIDDVSDRVTSLDSSVDGLSGRINTTDTNLYTLTNTLTNQVLASSNPDSLISRVAALDASFEEIALTVSDNLADIGTITSRFSWEGLGLRISSILSSGESSVLTDVNSMYIHLRYSAVGTSPTGSQMVYSMSNKPTSRSRSLGIALTSTSQAPTNKDNYKWVSLSGDVGAIPVQLDNIGTTYQIYRRYSNNSDGSNPTYQATGTTYIGLKIGSSGTEYWLQYRDVSSPISTYYTSDGIHFMKRDITEVDVGSITSEGFRLKNGIIEDGGFLRMGNYLWRPMVDKSLSFLYSPESTN